MNQRNEREVEGLGGIEWLALRRIYLWSAAKPPSPCPGCRLSCQYALSTAAVVMLTSFTSHHDAQAQTGGLGLNGEAGWFLRKQGDF
ncbi:hypothetical protein LY76DRAFT_272704 [Colletotrichum caudatum]|nr:hypothetical protein LY76DRAFT_272704 [Colletotrichum caudatum]